MTSSPDSGKKPPNTSTTRIAGRYELQEQLGEGGMGVVRRALDIKTGSYVAIKLMKDNSDPVQVELFAKEWRALAEMCHPNIVDVRDVDVIEENKEKKPFFVMPLLKGTTLAELIADASARLTPERIVEIAGQVCKGLQAAHQKGLIHRDLKPSNIFVMDDDTAKIIDFGIVHLAGTKSVTGQKGTWRYMSPEQAQLKEITPASDIFSLGVILYEAFTLRNPFACNTAEETVQAICKFIPPPVSEINPNINHWVSKVVHKCLAKQPIYRFSSARELAETLQKAFRNEAIFDTSKIQPRIERAKAAFKAGDEQFASEILAEIEAEGNLDSQITVLRTQIEMAVTQKKIRQLLESARARMEQDEIPLALDKVREVLQLDPENADALNMRAAMEEQRNETQIAKWMDLAQTHLENRDFGAARHAVQEVLAIHRSDTRALDLLEKIESTEADAKRIREQKEQLYGSALRAYQNGEIDTALSKLERLFSVVRKNPDAAVPERDAVYQTFYKEVRSQRDSIHGALEEAQRRFSEKDFAGALVICTELLAKRPNDGAFQALKIQIEDTERQELSAYIADVSKRAEAEPDLDRRANILRDACTRYPNESQFAQQLKLVRERRDLVNSIVAKARQYEARGQHSEAISQWNTLRNIHPQYPGIAFELEQCKKQRDRQARDEEKARVVEEIDGLMESRAYAKAMERAKAALQEFPGDTELAGLQGLAEQALERMKESRRLFEEGQKALEQKDFSRATDLLRSGLKLDPRGPGLRDALVNVLTERARVLVATNWRDAEPMYVEANNLETNHPAVRALKSTIAEAKRADFVGQCLTEARTLVASGNPQAAFERVHAGRGDYPNDLRLEQYEATLLKEVTVLQRAAERGRDKTLLEDDRRTLAQNPGTEQVKTVLERSQTIRAKHPDDPEIEKTVAEIEQAARHVVKKDDLMDLLRPVAPASGANVAEVAKPLPLPVQVPARNKGPQLEKVTKVFSKIGETAIAMVGGISALVPVVRKKSLEFARPGGKWSKDRLGAVGGVILLVVVAAFWIGHRRGGASTDETQKELPSIQVEIVTDPADSTVKIDSKLVSDRSISLPTGTAKTVEVSRPGYKTEVSQLTPSAQWKIALKPEPLVISVMTSEKSGTVELDGEKFGDLSEGSMEGRELPLDGNSHQLSVVAQGKQVFRIEFKGTPGSRAQVSPLDAPELLVVSSLGADASVYSGRPLKNAQIGNQPIASVTPSGVDLPPLTAQNHDLTYEDATGKGSVPVNISSAPLLVVRTVVTNPQVSINTNAEGATLTVDGQPMKHRGDAWQFTRSPGTHKFALSADGYEPEEWTTTLEQGQASSKTVTLRKVPTTSSLIIAGGTPGAEVDLDGKKLGELDANGAAQFPNALAAGTHSLNFQKSGYESRKMNLTSKPPAESRVADAKLNQLGTLAFKPTATTLTVKYRRSDETQFHEVSQSAKLPLPAGRYTVVANAAGFEEFQTEVTVVAGQPVIVSLNLTRPPPALSDPTQVVVDGDWLKSKNSGKYVYLKPNYLSVNLIFTRLKSNSWGNKKVHCVVESPDGAQVEYEIGDRKIVRKVTLGPQSAVQNEAKIDAVSATQPNSLSIHVQVEGSHVKLTNDKDQLLDDYVIASHDFSNGRVGVKADVAFMVKNNN